MRKFYRPPALLLAGCALLATAQATQAQDAEPTDNTPQDDSDDEAGEAIVVTGTRIRGGPVAATVTTLDRQAIVEAGQVDLGEALRALPQNFAGGQNPGIGFGAGATNSNVNSTSNANLRGLGPDATLTLLNGHRLPYSATFGGVDISAIPLAALDRIEVVPEGSSALYGSDAVAGVVNVILRRDFEGLATSAQLGAATNGGYFRQQGDIVGGALWDSGGALLAYDFANNSRIAARQRSFTQQLDPDTSLYPRMTRHAATLSAHQSLAPGIEASLDALYSTRSTQSLSAIPGGSYDAAADVESYTLAPSLKAGLGSGWEVKAIGVWGRDRTDFSTTITPDGGAPSVTQGCFCNEVSSLELGAEGPLFALPGGVARLAFGAGVRTHALDYSQAVDGTSLRAFDAETRSRFAYGEIYLPLLSPRNDVPLVNRLSASLALRYEDYRALEGLATPRIGITYSPFDGMLLRGSWGRSFKAPTLYQQYTPYEAYLLPAEGYGVGTGDEAVFYASGGNPDLEAERATSWTAGFEFRPMAMPGLKLEASWYDIRFRNRVARPIAGSIGVAFQDPGYASLLEFNPQPGRLEDLADGAQLGLENFTEVPFDPANVVVLLDNRNINVAAQRIEGIDASLAWSGDLPGDDRLSIDVAGSWLASSQQLTADLPEIRLAGRIFNPPEWRARGTASLTSGDLHLSGTLSYISALTDVRFAEEDRIEPGLTLDLGVSYDVGGTGADDGLFTLSLSVQNVFDREPAVIGMTGPTDTPYDSTNYSPIGRFVAIGIRRDW